ncbi:MAG TPA: DNA internalization-related competence protein ComEC/Rec2, partial [Lysobacter sp.]|nr:DNA internalization-related competence protein ComEC/Rec2 [Lysobacter sp.]
EASCVLRIESRHGAVLLLGDVGEVIERRLLRDHPGALRAEVVLVAHHGSAGSSEPGFVAATGARHAVISSGFGNRFGHPRPEVVERWQGAGARVHDTAGDGALRIRIQEDGVEVEARRRTHPRLWDVTRR